MNAPFPEILTLDQTCAYLQRSRSWIYQQIKTDPTFPAVLVGRRGYRFRLAALRAWVRAQEQESVEARLQVASDGKAGDAENLRAESERYARL